MPIFYHYTDDEGAKKIIRTGKIQASVNFMSGGDTAFGNGVYFTNLNPEFSSKADIAKNNWVNTGPQFIKKTENYFVIDIPEREIKAANAKDRNIFLYGFNNDLILRKYSWWLKNFDTKKILCSYMYQISSLGPVSVHYKQAMGDYVMIEETVNAGPVFKGSNYYLFMGSQGGWIVGKELGVDRGVLGQDSEDSLAPSANLPWLYSNPNNGNGEKEWLEDDSTVKASAWQK